jgi:hypothetical protein
MPASPVNTPVVKRDVLVIILRHVRFGWDLRISISHFNEKMAINLTVGPGRRLVAMTRLIRTVRLIARLRTLLRPNMLPSTIHRNKIFMGSGWSLSRPTATSYVKKTQDIVGHG